MNHFRELLLRRTFRLSILFAVSLIALCSFYGLSEGSFHNSDDVLYAQISREVGRGQIWPLTYSGNTYTAKPPLPFWITGAFVKLLGDGDSSYRLLPALSYAGIALASFLFFYQRAGAFSAWLALLLVLGSHHLALFSRRFMLDLPLCASLLAMFLAASKSPRWLHFWFWACVGWLTKEVAVLPGIAAVAMVMLWKDRDQFRKARLWFGFLGFAAVALFTTYARQTTFIPASTAAIQNDVLSMTASRSIYMDVLISEHPLMWLGLFLIPWIFLRHRSSSKFSLILAFAVLAQVAAVLVIKTVLPHYLLPLIPTVLLIVADAMGSHSSKGLRFVVLLFCAVFVVRNHWFQFDRANPDFAPAPATKALALMAKDSLPAGVPLCVVNMYFPGFRFYSDHATLGVYTDPRMYNAINRVAEFKGMLVSANYDLLTTIVQSKCGGLAVTPSLLARRMNWKVISAVEPLALVNVEN